MMIRSTPPRSMNLALMPVPAPAAMTAPPFFTVARRRSTTSLRVYGFPFPVQGFGIVQCWFSLTKNGGTLNSARAEGNGRNKNQTPSGRRYSQRAGPHRQGTRAPFFATTRRDEDIVALPDAVIRK